MSVPQEGAQAVTPAVITPGPTPMRRWVLWVAAAAILATVFGSIVVAMGTEGRLVAESVASRQVELGGGSFTLAGGWKAAALPDGVPPGGHAYTNDGVTLAIWSAPRNDMNLSVEAKLIAQQQFPAQVAAGNFLQQDDVGSYQVRMGLPDQVALTNATGRADFSRARPLPPDSRMVLAFSRGAPTDADGEPAGNDSNEFQATWGEVNAMLSSIVLEDQ
ncbi:MAG: hypothetical protein QG597_2811 [Actinomycetota bacterium]|nr:hypothetical protein [Actinomycetota bacterium]